MGYCSGVVQLGIGAFWDNIGQGRNEKWWSVEESYEYCRNLARSHYENFTVGSWFLPREKRPHVYAVYAFCRFVDDLGDESQGDRLGLLDSWEEELRGCYASRPSHPITVALAETIQRFHIPQEPFLKLIEANRMDQRAHRHRTYEDRLPNATPISNLFLAGEWVDTGWPGTMEGAVRSGQTAARALASREQEG